jgi:hypothetical protein
MVAPRAQQIVDRAAEERARFVAFIRSVPDEQWHNTSPEGIWHARDYVAHLASIDPLLTAWFRAIQSRPGGNEPGPAFSIDDWNEEQILARRETPIEDLIAEMERNRVDLSEALAAFTDEQLDRTIHFGGDNKRAPRDVQLFLYLSAWVFHDRWHTEDARRAIAGEAEQPFGDEAFARGMREQQA